MNHSPSRYFAAFALSAPRLGPAGETGRITEVGGWETGAAFVPIALALWKAISWAAVQIGIAVGIDTAIDLVEGGDEELADQPMTSTDWSFWDARLDALEAWGSSLLTGQRRWVWRVSIEKARKARDTEGVSHLDADMLIRELRDVVLKNLHEQEQYASSNPDPATTAADQAHAEALSAAAAQTLSPAAWLLIAASVGLLAVWVL